MPKKSKKQRKKENLAKMGKLQKATTIKTILCQEGKRNHKIMKMEAIPDQESKKEELKKIWESELSEQEKLIQSLIILNPEKVKEEDLVEEEGNVLYYSKNLNMEDFKKLSYPEGYRYQFSEYPRITFSLNGVEKWFVIRRA